MLPPVFGSEMPASLQRCLTEHGSLWQWAFYMNRFTAHQHCLAPTGIAESCLLAGLEALGRAFCLQVFQGFMWRGVKGAGNQQALSKKEYINKTQLRNSCLLQHRQHI